MKKKAKKTAKKKPYRHKNPGPVTEEFLTGELAPDLQDAWKKIRAFASGLGPQRIYASHNSIMFSRKYCYFFVRPKKSFLEVWFFLPRKISGLKATRGSKKAEKFSVLFKLVHADQVEEPLTDYLREAYAFIPEK